jgi:hypothetical protein
VVVSWKRSVKIGDISWSLSVKEVTNSAVAKGHFFDGHRPNFFKDPRVQLRQMGILQNLRLFNFDGSGCPNCEATRKLQLTLAQPKNALYDLLFLLSFCDLRTLNTLRSWVNWVNHHTLRYFYLIRHATEERCESSGTCP